MECKKCGSSNTELIVTHRNIRVYYNNFGRWCYDHSHADGPPSRVIRCLDCHHEQPENYSGKDHYELIKSAFGYEWFYELKAFQELDLYYSDLMVLLFGGNLQMNSKSQLRLVRKDPQDSITAVRKFFAQIS